MDFSDSSGTWESWSDYSISSVGTCGFCSHSSSSEVRWVNVEELKDSKADLSTDFSFSEVRLVKVDNPKDSKTKFSTDSSSSEGRPANVDNLKDYQADSSTEVTYMRGAFAGVQDLKSLYYSLRLGRPLVAPWITFLCDTTAYKWLCEVDLEYIADPFNLTGLEEVFENFIKDKFNVPVLKGQLSFYELALDTIAGVKPEEKVNESMQYQLQEAAKVLYGLIHARFILTESGLAKMARKYENLFEYDYGICPRLFCKDQKMLPIGLSDVPGQHITKLYCPRCMDIYSEERVFVGLDGAYFGTNFVHAFLMVYPQFRPPPPTRKYGSSSIIFKNHPLVCEIQLEASTATKPTYSSSDDYF